MAATEIVEAHNEEAVGVDRLPRADALVPPASFFVIRAVVAGSMMIAAESVADQHSVGALLIKLAIALVRQFIARQNTAASQAQGRIEVGYFRYDNAYGMRVSQAAHLFSLAKVPIPIRRLKLPYVAAQSALH